MPKRLSKILTLLLAVAACIAAAGIFVLDIDPKTGAATEIKLPTWGKRSVKTGR